MINIREAAMSKPSPKKENILFDEEYGCGRYNETTYNKKDRYDGNYDPSKKGRKEYYKDQQDYKERYENFTISMIINNDEVGPTADVCSGMYNEVKAEGIALEIAYDRIEELLRKEYTSIYNISFQAYSRLNEFKVEVTLSPIK